jgi:hypothetical protein
MWAYDYNHILNIFVSWRRLEFQRLYSSPRSTRGAPEASWMCGSGAVVATGCNTHTRVATAEAARSRRACRAPLGALGGCGPRDAHRAARKPRPPQRWKGSPAQAEGARKVSPPGVVRSRLQTSRAGRRRDGGLAVSTIGRRFIEKSRPACVSREAQARGSVVDPAFRATPHGAAKPKAQPARHDKRAAERWLFGRSDPALCFLQRPATLRFSNLARMQIRTCSPGTIFGT